MFPSAAGAFLPNHVVVLDPGHGGADSGVQSASHLAEKNLSLAIAQELVLLNPKNYSLILTRENDLNPGPEERAAMANHAGASLYISFHTGSGFSQNPGSCRVFYKKGEPYGDENSLYSWYMGQQPFVRDSEILAGYLAGSIGALKLFTDSRPEEMDSIILASIAMPAILIEFGNLLSPQDALLLSEKKTQQRLAKAIHQGISAYLAGKEKAFPQGTVPAL